MGGFRTNDLDPGGDSFGEASSASTQDFAIPTLENGDMPERCRVGCTGTVNFWISVSTGAKTVTNIIGMHINYLNPLIIKTWGHTHFNHIADATGSRITVTPLNP